MAWRKRGETKPPQRAVCDHQANAASNLQQELPQDGRSGKCEICVQEHRAARRYRWKLIGGLMFPFMLQALDVTIIASAVPWIASYFNEIEQLNWIVSAFNLTSAAFIPFWGQMADIFGRHAALQACIVVMMVGSALCTAAPQNAFPVLLLGRGFQGVGCAGIGVIVRIILSDKVSLKENAKNWSIFSATAGVSYGIGPVLGGYLAVSNWRWCFGINLPVCLVAIITLFLLLRSELLGPQPIAGLDDEAGADQLAVLSKRILTIDFGGQLLFLAGFMLIVLALTWSGTAYQWQSAAVIAPLVIGVVLAGLFLLWERLMIPGGRLARRWPGQRSMIPWKLLANRDIGLLFYITIATGAAMYAVLYFCSVYFTAVKGNNASNGGVQLLYYVPGMGVGVYLSMVLCNAWPRNTFFPIMLGSVVEACGIGILAYALQNEKTATIYGMMAMTAAGTALRFMPVTLHAVGIFPNDIAACVSILTLAMPFGGTIALTIMSTVYYNIIGRGVSRQQGSGSSAAGGTDAASQDFAVQEAKRGIFWAFIAITPIMVLCVFASSLLGRVRITKKEKADLVDDSYGEDVTREPYLFYLLKRRRGQPQPAAIDDNDEVVQKASVVKA